MTTPAAGWHAGERALHARAGIEARMADLGQRVLRDHMPDQHREFFAQLPFLVAGTLDAQGQPWASLLAGPPGFAHSPDPRVLRVAAPEGQRGLAEGRVEEGAPLALLGLQAHTGRRNRMNGWVETSDASGFHVRVGQSFGNCPKYIRPREALHAPAAGPASVTRLQGLDAEARRLVGSADTLFIATAHPAARERADATAGPDVSHRGGAPGFVALQEDGSLWLPDYVGNSFFNTLGNLQLEPRCGLLFIDFATGEQLHLAARGTVLWEGPERDALPGALRVLKLEVGAGLRVRGGLPLQWRES